MSKKKKLLCVHYFIGLNCEQKYSECMNHPCLNNGTCLDYNGFTCQCLEGFSGRMPYYSFLEHKIVRFFTICIS